MPANNASKTILSARTLGAVLAAVFAVFAAVAAGCAPTNTAPGPVPPAPTSSSR